MAAKSISENNQRNEISAWHQPMWRQHGVMAISIIINGVMKEKRENNVMK